MNSQFTSNVVVILISCFVFLLAAFPLRNFLEIQSAKREFQKWNIWLKKGSSKENLLNSENSPNQILCDYCGSGFQFKKIEAIIIKPPTFKFFKNEGEKKYQYNSFFCRGCSTELYRERVKFQ